MMSLSYRMHNFQAFDPSSPSPDLEEPKMEGAGIKFDEASVTLKRSSSR